MKNETVAYEDLILGYYGKRKKPELSRQRSFTITKVFDDGMSINLNLGYSEEEFVEYEVAQSLDPFIEYDIAMEVEEFVEYEVVSAAVTRNPTAVQENVDYATAYGMGEVENKEAEPSPPSVETKCHCEEEKKEGQKTNYEVKPVTVQSEKSETANKKGIPESMSALFNDLNDEDFMADMQSILKGQKVYDEKTKQAVPKDQVRKVATEQGILNVKDTEPEIKSLDQKNEHAIFDKIANSMKFANAYDLGSMDLEKRFDEFDQIQEWEATGNKKKVEPAPQQGAVRAGTEPNVEYADFIEDLDLIKEASGTAENKQKSEKEMTEIEGKDAPENPA